MYPGIKHVKYTALLHQHNDHNHDNRYREFTILSIPIFYSQLYWKYSQYVTKPHWTFVQQYAIYFVHRACFHPASDLPDIQIQKSWKLRWN